MDCNGIYNDNFFIERLWCTVKYEEVCLKPYRDARETQQSLALYFHFYNTDTERPHQSLAYRTSVEVNGPTDFTKEGMIKSLPIETGLHLIVVPSLS